jgi:hypothetical protein
MRKITVLTLYALIALALCGAGCAGKASWKYVRAGQDRYSAIPGFSANFPARWMLFEDRPARTLLLTRHSVPMEFIQIKRLPLFTPLPNTAQTVNAGMKPYEVAEAAANSLRAAQGVFDLTVENLSPVEIGGMEGFEMMLSYSMENGMRRRCLIYGFISGDSNGKNRCYVEIGLYALEDYYFEAALEDFLAVVKSIVVQL